MAAVNPWLAVFLGGALGATLRFGVDLSLDATLADHGGWLATTFVNFLGAWLLGWIRGHGLAHVSASLRLGLTTGVLGSFTTWSAILVGVWVFVDAGSIPEALGFLALNLGGGVAAAWWGWSTGERRVARRSR